MPVNTLTTDVAVCNVALMKLGAGQITSFSEDDDRARVALEIYEVVVRAAMVKGRWRFNMALAQLVRDVGTPLEEFSAQYGWPAEALQIHRVAVNNNPIRWDIFGDFIVCNAQPTDDVIATYSFRAPEQNWTADFTDYVTDVLASQFAAGLTRNGELALALAERAERRAANVLSRVAQNRTPDRVDTGAFVRGRMR